LSLSANSIGVIKAITEEWQMEKFAQSGGGTIYVSVKILFARVAAATISQEGIAGFGDTVHAALR
jgi:hypothetical protein